MTFRTWFEKQVFVRLTEDRAAFICTTKWRLFSIIGRVGVGETGPDFASQIREPGSIAAEELPVFQRCPVEQGSTRKTAEV
ncbi:MAG: hypothetical protein ABSB35_24325 [Bryobacteraceae bacterium]|jgi:hypothetical protein